MKISPDDILKIRAMRDTKTNAEIAVHFGITENYVSRLGRGGPRKKRRKRVEIEAPGPAKPNAELIRAALDEIKARKPVVRVSSVGILQLEELTLALERISSSGKRIIHIRENEKNLLAISPGAIRELIGYRLNTWP